MSDEGFLGRWSRRKRAALAAPIQPAPAVAPTMEPPTMEPTAGEPTAELPFDPATLPPVDTLTAASEIRDFLREGVPAALRQAALRRVWALDPAIAGFIGPADYAWDFNAPDGMAGFAQSMPADMGRMLAQAIGLEQPRDPGRDTPGTSGQSDQGAAGMGGAGEAAGGGPDEVGQTQSGEATAFPRGEVNIDAPNQAGLDGSSGMLAGSAVGPAAATAAPLVVAATVARPIGSAEPAVAGLPKRHGAATPV